MPLATKTDELRFLRTLTPPPSSSNSNSDSESDYDPYRSPTPENTTGVVFDHEDRIWRCVHCGWEVETVDGVQGICKGGHVVGFFPFSFLCLWGVFWGVLIFFGFGFGGSADVRSSLFLSV